MEVGRRAHTGIEPADAVLHVVVQRGIGLLVARGVDEELGHEHGRRHLIHIDRYGRAVPQGLNKSVSLTSATSSSKKLREAFLDTYDKYADRKLSIRKLTLTVGNLSDEGFQQVDMFTDQNSLEREKKMQKAMLDIKRRFGKNAVMKANNLQNKATAKERNEQIGGHRA